MVFLHHASKDNGPANPGGLTPLGEKVPAEPAPETVRPADALEDAQRLVIQMCFAVYLTFIFIAYAWGRFIRRRI